MRAGRWLRRAVGRNRFVHPLIGRLDTLAMLRDSGAAALRIFQDLRRDFPDVTPVGELVLGIYGRQIYLKGDRANATRLREQAAALYARSFAAENEIARALMYNGDTAAALGHFKKALAYSPYNWKLNEKQPPVKMALTISDSAGTRIGHLHVDTTRLRVENLAVGGDHIWVATSHATTKST